GTHPTGSLQVTINPASAITAGAEWQVDDGASNESGTTVTDLSVGAHTVSFTSISGWFTPSDETVTIKKGATTKVSGLYKALPPNSAPLVLQTNGDGTIQHSAWPPELVIGKEYTATAVAKAGNFFSDWVASGSANFVSNNPVL